MPRSPQPIAKVKTVAKKTERIKKPAMQKSAPALPLKASVKAVKAPEISGLHKNIVFRDKKFVARFHLPSGSLYSLSLIKYSYTVQNKKNIINLANAPHINEILNFTPGQGFSKIRLIGTKAGKNSIEFIYKLDGSIVLTKTYRFSSENYSVHLLVSAKNLTGSPAILNGSFILAGGLNPNIKNEPYYLNYATILYVNNKSITPESTPSAKYRGNISFAGFNSKYFLFSAIAPTNLVYIKKSDNNISFIFPERFLVSSKKIFHTSFTIYAGPKKLSLLNAIGHDTATTLNYGFFSFFSILLLHVLEFFYSFVHNYGLAIILLVIAIRIVFYPLTYAGFKSMKQMQKLTPKISELREQYKDNKQELNKKIMELYKESKVNPFGGCLPMLLQIPVFYGLYETLLISIQLRNAPFFLWIANLSTKDPYYILPILMGITMFISQKMNPVVGDPTQAKMMLILPVIFTVIFVNFPAGLLLYWTVNNVLTIMQQYIINKKFA